MSELNKYEEKKATDEGQRGAPRGKQTGVRGRIGKSIGR